MRNTKRKRRGRDGDYGRRWRKEFAEFVENEREEFLKLDVNPVIVDPTRLDERVTYTKMDRLQPLLRRLQEKMDLPELTDKFTPIWLTETKMLYRFAENERVVVIVNLAETDVSGGTAIELGNIAHAGAPCYLFAAEDIIKHYRSRHVIVALHYNGRRILRRKNIFHNAEDVMVALKKDLPRILAMNEFPVFGRLFFELWVKKLADAGKIRKETARRLLKIKY